MRRTAMARTPFKRKNAASSTSTKAAENKQSNWPESHSQQARVAIESVVKMQAKSTNAAPAIATAFRGSVPKAQPVRNEAYRRAVASLPCVICGVPGYSQAAHMSYAGAATGKGMGIKSCDLTCVPLCADRAGVRGHHSQLDQGALFSKAARHALEPVWAADTQRRINAMGLWPKNLPYPRAALDT